MSSLAAGEEYMMTTRSMYTDTVPINKAVTRVFIRFLKIKGIPIQNIKTRMTE